MVTGSALFRGDTILLDARGLRAGADDTEGPLETGEEVQATLMTERPLYKPGERVRAMVHQMEAEGFGSCRNYAECEANCPKEISIKFIGRMNRDYLRATLVEPRSPRGPMESQ